MYKVESREMEDRHDLDSAVFPGFRWLWPTMYQELGHTAKVIPLSAPCPLMIRSSCIPASIQRQSHLGPRSSS
jgi:hypothetical protein